MRIGLFGGTFDPVHLGHLRACLEVKEGFNLDRVYLIPSATPPHKASTRVSDPAVRLEILQAAVAGAGEFVVSPAEFNRSGPSYTIDTVRKFQSEFSGDYRLYLIIRKMSDIDRPSGTYCGTTAASFTKRFVYVYCQSSFFILFNFQGIEFTDLHTFTASSAENSICFRDNRF